MHTNLMSGGFVTRTVFCAIYSNTVSWYKGARQVAPLKLMISTTGMQIFSETQDFVQWYKHLKLFVRRLSLGCHQAEQRLLQSSKTTENKIAKD